jgi:multimeric flavodoxin WrbA
MQIKILALCGSPRRDSLNQKLLDIAVLGALDAGAQVSNIRCAISRCRFMTAIGKLNMDFPNARVRSRR